MRGDGFRCDQCGGSVVFAKGAEPTTWYFLRGPKGNGTGREAWEFCSLACLAANCGAAS